MIDEDRLISGNYLTLIGIWSSATFADYHPDLELDNRIQNADGNFAKWQRGAIKLRTFRVSSEKDISETSTIFPGSPEIV